MEHNSAVRTVGYVVGVGVLLFVLFLVVSITTGILPWRDSYAQQTPSGGGDTPTAVTTATPTPDTEIIVVTPTPSPTPTPIILDEELPTYTVTVTFSKGGTAIPYGMNSVVEHGSMEIVAVPDEGYAVENFILDGASLGPMTNYTLEDVTENHSVYISFTRSMHPAVTPTPEPTDEPASEVGPDENGNYG